MRVSSGKTKTSKLCESETSFQKRAPFWEGGRSLKMRHVVTFRGLLDIFSLENIVSLLVGPGFGLLTPLTLWASNSLASLPGLQDSRIAKSALLVKLSKGASNFEK